MFDSHWRPVRRPGAFRDSGIPAWYAPFGIAAFGDRIFVTYAFRAPVNGNDEPERRLRRRVRPRRPARRPCGPYERARPALGARAGAGGIRPARRRPPGSELRQRADQRLRHARDTAGRSAADHRSRSPASGGSPSGRGAPAASRRRSSTQPARTAGTAQPRSMSAASLARSVRVRRTRTHAPTSSTGTSGRRRGMPLDPRSARSPSQRRASRARAGPGGSW